MCDYVEALAHAVSLEEKLQDEGQEHMDTISKLVDACDEDISKARQQVEEIQAKHDEAVSSLASEVVRSDSYCADVTRLTNQLDEVREARNGLYDENARLKAKVDELERKMQRLELSAAAVATR